MGAIKAYRLHTDVKSLVTLETSDPFLNQLWAVGQATRLNNIHSYLRTAPVSGSDMAETSSLYCQHRWQIWRLRRCWKKCCGFCQRPTIGWCNDCNCAICRNHDKWSIKWWWCVRVAIGSSELALALVKNYGKQAAVAKLRPHLERHLNYLLALILIISPSAASVIGEQLMKLSKTGSLLRQISPLLCLHVSAFTALPRSDRLEDHGNEDYCQQ